MLEISKGICNFILIVSIEGKRGQLLISGKIVGSLAISSDYQNEYRAAVAYIEQYMDRQAAQAAPTVKEAV